MSPHPKQPIEHELVPLTSPFARHAEEDAKEPPAPPHEAPEAAVEEPRNEESPVAQEPEHQVKVEDGAARYGDMEPAPKIVSWKQSLAEALATAKAAPETRAAEPLAPQVDEALTAESPAPPASAQAAVAAPAAVNANIEQWESALNEAAASARDEQDREHSNGSSAARSMLGLAVVWGVLYLLAYAQKLSENDISFGVEPATGRSARRASLYSALDVRQKVMLPGDVRFHQAPGRQIVKLLLQGSGMRVSDAGLALISDKPRSIEERGKPLYELLHTIIDDPAVGFALRSKEAFIFRQKLENTEPATGPLRQFEWQAIVDVSVEPTVLFPAGRSDLWAIISVPPPSTDESKNEQRFAVEIWRSGRPEAMAEGVLGPNKKAQLSFSSEGTVLVTIEEPGGEPAPPSPNGAPYRIRIFDQKAAKS